jgi:hypothetical protein
MNRCLLVACRNLNVSAEETLQANRNVELRSQSKSSWQRSLEGRSTIVWRRMPQADELAKYGRFRSLWLGSCPPRREKCFGQLNQCAPARRYRNCLPVLRCKSDWQEPLRSGGDRSWVRWVCHQTGGGISERSHEGHLPALTGLSFPLTPAPSSTRDPAVANIIACK